MTDIKEEPFRNSDQEYWENIDVNDCSYIVRALEREAYTSVVNALRAKGPPSEHTFLLLDHLKSALSINNELGRAEIRRAAFDPKLCKVSKVLNPNYDTCTEWSGCSTESRGFVEAGPSRAKPFANTTTTSIADQLLRQANTNNEKVNRRSGRAVELLTLPHTPFVPERLRLLLRETDRPEHRMAHPLETPLPPPIPVSVSVSTPADRTAISEDKPPPKKRRKRTSKAAKLKEDPPELRPAKSPKIEDGPSLHPVTLESPSSIAVPVTPMAASTVASSSAIVGSGGSNVISPGQPPQSGDAMKTWVSKIHEKEMAASAKKNGSVVSPDDVHLPSVSSSIEDPAKRKRRSKAPAQDPLYLNSCARTRPFQFEKGLNGCKPPRGNPDKRYAQCRSSSNLVSPGISTHLPSASSGVGMNASSAAYGSGSITTLTPVTRPNPVETHLGYGGRNGVMDGLPPSMAATVATPSAATPAYFRPPVPSTPTNTQVKRGQGSAQSARSAQGRSYYVNNCGVAMVGPPGSSNAVRSLSSTGGIGGRSGSLGSQQLTALQGISSGVHFTCQKATASNSNSSMNSSGGGSTGSGIGASSSGTSLTEPAQPVSARPPEDSGHDYGIPHPLPPYPSPSPAGSSQSSAPLGFDPVKGKDPPGVRKIPGWHGARSRFTDPPMYRASQPLSSQNTTFTSSNGLLSSMAPLHPSTPVSLPSILQRTGSMSSMRARSGSRGTAAAGGISVTGERERGCANRNDPVTDGMVQATVNNIMLEAAQKECANGKRSEVPRELLEKRDNGLLLNRRSPAVPSMQQGQSMQSTTQSFPSFPPVVSGPSMEERTAATMLSMMASGVGSGLAYQPPPHPSLHKTPILAALTTPSSLPSQPSQPSQPSTSSLDPSSFGRSSTVGMGSSIYPPTSSLLPLSSLSSLSSLTSLSSVADFIKNMSTSSVQSLFGIKDLSDILDAVSRGNASDSPINEAINALMRSTSLPPVLQQQQPQPAAPVVSAAASPVVEGPPRPAQRQYVLQPQGMGYAEFNPNNPMSSFKSFAADGTPVQYGVSPEELYDQGILARPSTSGMNGPSPLSFGIVQHQQQHQQQLPTGAGVSAQLGVPSSALLIPSTSNAGRSDNNGEMPSSMPAISQSQTFVPHHLQQLPVQPAATAANVPREGGGSTEVTDILEQSCMELR